MADGMMIGGNLLEQLARFIGTTVTIYTTSGGLSGAGITGVLVCVDPCFIKLITCIGPAPCCPLGSACTCGRIGCGFGGGCGGGFGGGGCGSGGFGGCGGGPCISNVGSVAVIPICSIAAYVHNAV